MSNRNPFRYGSRTDNHPFLIYMCLKYDKTITSLICCTAIVPNPDMEWLGGMSGILSIDLPKEERSQNLWLPLTAICHRPQKGDYVWVVKGDKVNSVPVKLGEQRNNQIEIVEGITENDLVVLTRQRFLSENSTVTIQK